MEGVEEWLGGQWRPSEHLKAERVSRARGVRARMHRRGQDVQGLVAGGPETAGGSENRPEQGAGPRATGAPVRNGTGVYPATGEAWRQDQATAPPLPGRGSWWVVPSL